jgi:hypothetical protein
MSIIQGSGAENVLTPKAPSGDKIGSINTGVIHTSVTLINTPNAGGTKGAATPKGGVPMAHGKQMEDVSYTKQENFNPDIKNNF